MDQQNFIIKEIFISKVATSQNGRSAKRITYQWPGPKLSRSGTEKSTNWARSQLTNLGWPHRVRACWCRELEEKSAGRDQSTLLGWPRCWQDLDHSLHCHGYVPQECPQNVQHRPWCWLVLARDRYQDSADWFIGAQWPKDERWDWKGKRDHLGLRCEQLRYDQAFAHSLDAKDCQAEWESSCHFMWQQGWSAKLKCWRWAWKPFDTSLPGIQTSRDDHGMLSKGLLRPQRYHLLRLECGALPDLPSAW